MVPRTIWTILLLVVIASAGVNLSKPVAAADVREVHVAAVLVEFTDLEIYAHHYSVSYIDSLIFEKMRDYYLEISYGRLLVTGLTTSKWYTLPHSMVYYGMGTAFNYDSKPEKIDELMQDSIAVADAEIDYRSFDVVFIVHARGSEQALGGPIAEPYICTRASRYSGDTNDGYVSLPVAIVSEFDPLGFYAHEFGHNLGLPDLYDYDAGWNPLSENFVGWWDLMGVGEYSKAMLGLFGSSPPHMSSFCKIQLGWVDPSQILVVNHGETKSSTVDPLEISSNGILTIKIPIKESSYYLVETTRKILYDKSLPDSGVVIYLCDESIPSGHGPVRVQDADPSTYQLYEAFHVGTTFVDDALGLRISVLEERGNSFVVQVSYAQTISATSTTSTVYTTSYTQTSTSMTAVSTQVTYQGNVLHLEIWSSSLVSGLNFDINKQLLNFMVSGPDGTDGFCSVLIPRALLDGTPIVFLDGKQVQSGASQDEENYYVYFTFGHSSHDVTIGGSNTIPDLPYALITLLLAFGFLHVVLFATKAKRKSRCI